MSAGTHSVRARLEEALRGFMDREAADLREEELDMAARSLRALRADAYDEDNEALYRACSRTLEALRRHRQRRVVKRDRRDRADGRWD